MLTLSVATSIDALAVGLSFTFLGVNIWMASLTIGVIAFLATLVAFSIENQEGTLWGVTLRLSVV